MQFPDELHEMIAEKAVAVLTTAMPSGDFQSQVMWFDITDSTVRINTQVDRVKYRNLQRDPRCSLVVVHPKNPYSYVEIRGRATSFTAGQAGREHIDELSQHYLGSPYGLKIKSERVTIEIEPHSVEVRSPFR